MQSIARENNLGGLIHVKHIISRSNNDSSFEVEFKMPTRKLDSSLVLLQHC